MPILKHLLIMAVLLLSTSCSHVSQPIATEPSATESPFLLSLPAHTLGHPLSLSQQLTIEYNEQTHHIDGLLEVDNTTINIALVKFGQRFMSVRQTQAQPLSIQKNERIPDTIDGAHILSNIQLVFWPVERIVTVLPKAYRLTESDSLRTLSLHNKTIMTVLYQKSEPRWQKVILTNFELNYRMTILSESSS